MPLTICLGIFFYATAISNELCYPQFQNKYTNKHLFVLKLRVNFTLTKYTYDFKKGSNSAKGIDSKEGRNSEKEAILKKWAIAKKGAIVNNRAIAKKKAIAKKRAIANKGAIAKKGAVDKNICFHSKT